MDIINSRIDRARQKLWLYGSIALALIVGMTLLVGANRVAAHEGLGSTIGDGGALVQAYDSERDEHVVHVHPDGAVADGDTWQIYFGSSRVIDCTSRSNSSWRDADESSRSSDIVAESNGLTLTLDSGDHNLGVCVRYDTNTSLDPGDDDFNWTYADADSVATGPQNLVVDLRGPTISIDAAGSNEMEVEVDGLKEASEPLVEDDGDTDTNNRIRYAFLDGSACDATTLTDETRDGPDDGASLIVVGSLSSDLISEDEASSGKDGATFKIDAAWARHGKYLCVEVTDQVGNSGYGSEKVDVDVPATLTQVPSSANDGTGRVSISSSESGVQFSYSSDESGYQVANVAACSDSPVANSFVLRSSIPDGGYKYGSTTNVICVIAVDSKKNEAKIAFVIDQEPPTISVVLQSNQIVYAIGSDGMAPTEAPADVDVVRSSEGQVRWESRYIDALAYYENDPDPDQALVDACEGADVNVTDFKGSDNTYATYTTGTRNSRIDLSKNSAYRDRYDAICFRISDVAGQEKYMGVLIKDFEVLPVIEGDRDERSPMLKLSIDVDGNVAWSWDVAAVNADCSSENADGFEFTEPSPDSTITVEADDVAYCVRATVDTKNYYGIVVGVAEGEVLDTTAPMVSIGDVDSNNMISATATDDDGSGVAADSWQHTVLDNEDSARDNCNDKPIQAIADGDWMDGSSLTATAAHSNKYVCFRVMDEVGNYGYNSASLPTIEDTTPPTLTVTQSGNTLSWDAQDAGGIATYEYQLFDSEGTPGADSCMTDSGWVDGMNPPLAETDNGVYYCFRVTDHGDNIAHAGPLMISGVDTTAPVITVSQSANTVSAIPGELNTSGWQHIRSDEDPGECSGLTGWGDVKMTEEGRRLIDLTADDSGKWVCFRVMDAAGNYGYKKFQIETITAEEEDETSRTASDGSLQFSLEGQRLTVSLAPAEGETEAPAVISWNYLFFGSEDGARNNCTAEDNQFDEVVPGTRYSFNVRTSDSRGQQYVHLGKWFCFRAIDENNEEAFGVFQVPAQLSDGTTTTTPPEQPPVETPPTTPDPGDDGTTPDPGDDGQQPGQPGQPGDDGTTPDPGDDGTTPDPGDDGTTPDPGDDGTTPPADPVDGEGGFLSDYLWYIIGAVVVVILIVVFVAMGSKGNQRE